MMNEGVNRLVAELGKFRKRAFDAELDASRALGTLRAVADTSMQAKAHERYEELRLLEEVRAVEWTTAVTLVSGYLDTVFATVEAWD